MSPEQEHPEAIEGERPTEFIEPIAYAARPARLRPKAHRRTATADVVPLPPFEPDGRNPAYVAWLEQQSMLHDATMLGRQLAGHAAMWANPYANPDPRAAVRQASVWFTAYPISHITGPGQSFLATLGSEELWAAFAKIGIEGVHTGPLKLAGGSHAVEGRQMLSQRAPFAALGSRPHQRAATIHQQRRRAQQRPAPDALALDLRVERERRGGGFG